MSQVIGQSATAIAQSPVEFNRETYDYQSLIQKLAMQSTKSQSIVCKFNLNQQSLRDSVKNVICQSYPQLFPKDQLDKETWEKVWDEVKLFVEFVGAKVNASNQISSVSKFYGDEQKHRITIRHTNVGEDVITPRQEIDGAMALRFDAKARLRKLVEANNIDNSAKIAACERKIAFYEKVITENCAYLKIKNPLIETV